MIYAHSLKEKSESAWQPLSEHSCNVSGLAESFAKPFHSAAWAKCLGLLHDAGKARISFQNYLKASTQIETDDFGYGEHSHSGAGACWCSEKLGPAGCILSYCIAGHHAGLPDWIGGATPNGALLYRLQQEKGILLETQVRDWFQQYNPQEWIGKLRPPWKFHNSSEPSFWIRMLFSCLVDADFLDTEYFMDHERSHARMLWEDLTPIAKRFFAELDRIQSQAPDTPVNQVRSEIREDCERAALEKPGLFSLTVPTGGGKTLSGTAFALRHALKFGKKRIIYVIPYTSIIEQTSDVLRRFVGENSVLEHHSNFAPEKETLASQVASENWDAPIIVTTSVQFFESLYASSPGKCRKLHNIADSVVILDEVQLLPKHLLIPCCEAIRQLAEYYGTTFVLSTATQPDLKLENVREIIAPERNLYQRLKRTAAVFPENIDNRRSWKDIAEEISSYPQVLCIVNTRKDCRTLFSLLPEGTIHLSASMCGEHRSKTIKQIREKLNRKEPVRVISTQLVEAGVDFDFPVVYRAYTGLTSIAQAAGRCNREGLLNGLGKMVVFLPPEPAPPGELRKAEDALTDMLQSPSGISMDLPSVFPAFDQIFTDKINEHGEDFQALLEENARDFQFPFRTAAQQFQMIDDQHSAPVIVRYGNSSVFINSLLAVGPKRDIMRRLQRFTVNTPKRICDEMLEKGMISEPFPGIFVQEDPACYQEDFGFDLLKNEWSAADLII